MRDKSNPRITANYNPLVSPFSKQAIKIVPEDCAHVSEARDLLNPIGSLLIHSLSMPPCCPVC